MSEDTVINGAGRGFPRVEGKCPACGVAALFLATGAFVTCANLRCSNPCAPSESLGAL